MSAAGHYPEGIKVDGSWNPGALDEIGRRRLIHNEGRHLEFGKGDIGIHMGDTSDVALLLFRNLDTPAPIEELLNRQRSKVEIVNSDVVMGFSNTDSIDALMKCLRIVKRKLSGAMPEKAGQEIIP